MKLIVRRPITKKFAGVAVASAAIIACVTYATTVAAQADTSSGSTAAAATHHAASTGWQLKLHVAEGITEAAVCDYGASRYGDNCTLWLLDGSSQTLNTMSRTFADGSHIAVIWSPANFNLRANNAYATPGHWNLCTLPESGSGTKTVTAANGTSNCLK